LRAFYSLTFRKNLLILIGITIFSSCSRVEEKLLPVSYSQFETFVNETNYETDAERYGWSIVQLDVFNFTKVDSATWKIPDGIHVPISKELPVTQVSYNDAMAYCKWANCRLPSYDKYWKLIKEDNRKVIADNNAPISSINEVNILGNVWELTQLEDHYFVHQRHVMVQIKVVNCLWIKKLGIYILGLL